MLENLVQLHRAGRLDEAEAGYRQALADRPDDAEALHLLGILRGQRGDLREALTLVRRACELDPENATCRHTLGEMCLSEGLLDEAGQAYDEARRLNPNLAPAHAGLGRVALARGDLDAAQSHFTVALRADEDDVPGLTGLGNVARMRGDPERALQYLTQAAERSPDDPFVQCSYAEAMLDQGMLDFAAKAIDNALAVTPAYPLARALRAELHVRKGEHALALPIYESLLAREEQVGIVRTGLGDIARAEGRSQDAIAQYTEALRVQPWLEAAAVRRADVLANVGRLAEAIGVLQQQLVQYGGGARTHARLARLLSRAGRNDEALDIWRQAETHWPDDVDLKAQHALTLDRAGRSAEALEVAELAAASPRPALAMLRARGALLAGDPAGAVQRLEKISDASLADKPALLAGRRQRLLGLAYDALEQWPDAAAAFLRMQRTIVGGLPSLPALDPRGRDQLRRLADAPELAEPRGEAPVLLCGLPGCGARQVAGLLADQPGWHARRERSEVAPDFLSAPFDPHVFGPLVQSELGLLARRYRRPLERAGVASTLRIADWLPLLDARLVPVLKRVFPGLKLVIVGRKSHDMLLNWLAFGWAHGFALIDPVAGARWLQRAALHLTAAAALLPTIEVDPDALSAAGDPEPRRRLATFLGLAGLEPGEHARAARTGHAGMPVAFPRGHASHYRKVLAEAFAILDAVG